MAAAVKFLVTDAIQKTLSARVGTSFSRSANPYPRLIRTFPSRNTPMVRPGTDWRSIAWRPIASMRANSESSAGTADVANSRTVAPTHHLLTDESVSAPHKKPANVLQHRLAKRAHRLRET